jgi:hypothetical protein
MDYKEKLQPFKEKIENYVIMEKLTNNKDINLTEEEFMPYDGYNIKCPTIRITKNDFAKTTLFAISINPDSGEFIIEIYNLSSDNNNKLNVYISYINRYNYSFNNSSLYTDRYYEHFSGCFWNNDDMVEKILDLYLVI